MADVTVKQFAEVVGVPPDRLLSQLGEAGLSISDENFETVGGWVLDLFGRVPHRGESVEAESATWVVSTLIWKAATPMEPGIILRTTSRTVGSFQGLTH